MATRSFIALQHSDNTYTAVYCHWDGYPEHNGKILKEQYSDLDSVIHLIDGGDISSLQTDKDWNDNSKEVGPLYYADRGETDVEPKHYSSFSQLKDAANQHFVEFLYWFNRNEWDYIAID